MLISVVSRADVASLPEALALAASLRAAGNTVTVVHPGGPVLPVADIAVVSVAGRRSLVRRLLDRAVPPRARRSLTDRRLRRAVVRSGAEIVYPARRADSDLTAGDAAVVLDPRWGVTSSRDLARLAPHDVRWSSASAGAPLDHHLHRAAGPPSQPAPGRHAGVSIAVAARFTSTSPARYLRAALERAGIEVVALDGGGDWSQLPADCAGIMIVESPLPVLELTGTRPPIPVLFWVHHGEHHVDANVRLAGRYGADAVLLAHSWHLAHRFAVPVHRFPFAIAPGLVDSSRPLATRSLDVAMVAAGVDEPQRAYSRRYEVTRRLAAALPGSTSFRSGVTPEEMAAVYGDSRIVLNDGGDRHRPITMRVFEALGSGAALLTEDVPGLDLLLEPGVHYCILLPDAVEQVRTLLASEQLASLAAAGERFARGRHTYDHRVDELLRLFAATAAGSAPRRRIPADPIAAAVDADVDVQTVAVFGADLDLPDRAVYAEPAAAARVVRSQVDAVVVGDAGTDLEAALAGARRYVYATTAIAEAVRAALPNAGVTMRGDLVRFDLGAPGYRLR